MLCQKIQFSDWFDVRNIEHAKALVYHLEQGGWPKHFLPADVSFDDEAIYTALKQVAKVWAEHFGPHCRSANPPVQLEFGGQTRE